MSLIPYPSSQQEVVLRHGSAVVVLDPQSQQMTLRNTSADPVDHGTCPYCHRRFQDDHDTFQDSRDHPPTPTEAAGFVNPDYFRMLADRVAPSRDTSPSPSPTGLFRALRSGQSRNVSASGSPAANAEFLASSPAPPVNDQQKHNIKNSSFLPGYFKRFFVERRTLGRGGHGVVMLVEHVLDGVSLGEFACKRIPVGNDHDWLAKVLIEVQLLQRLMHPNLVAYRHVWLEDAQTTKFGPSVPCVFILQQYCNAGDLQQYVQAASTMPTNTRPKGRKASAQDVAFHSGQLSLDEILAFFKDITSGLHHLHSHGYIHRDLKPSNCLLHSDGRRISVHVSDFGEVQATTSERASTGATGTISYCAPEVLQRRSPDGAYGNFTTKSDIFSLGMILYYMCFAELPYTHADVNEVNEDLDLLRAEITTWPGLNQTTRKRTDLPDKLYDVLRRLLSISPHDRPSTAEILASAQSNDADDLSAHRTWRTASDPKPERPSDALKRRPSVQTQQWRNTTSSNSTSLSPTRWTPEDQQTDSQAGAIAHQQADDHPLERKQSSSPSSRPLLLPPPRSTPRPARTSPLHVRQTFRAVVFVLKIAALSVPCAPFAPRVTLLYPLLGLGAWELVASPFGSGWVADILGLALHLVVLLAAERWEGICAG